MLPRLAGLAVLTLCSLITMNCSNDTNPVTPASGAYVIPLAIGNSWSYHYTLYDTAGKIRGDFYSSLEILGDSMTNGQTWYYHDNHGPFFGNKPDGFYTWGTFVSDPTQATLQFKYPCKLGEKYSYWEVVRLDTAITVPAGTFDCIEYSYRERTQSTFSYSDVFVKPGIGEIKVIRYGLIDNFPIFVSTISELTSFRSTNPVWPG